MKKTYHIITIGCQMNKSDSERIAAYLELYNFKHEPDIKMAGLVVINTCGVRQASEDRNYGLIPDIKKDNPKVKIIVAGCLSEEKIFRKRLARFVDAWLPIRELPDLYKKLDLIKIPSIKRGVRPGRTGCVFGDENDYLSIVPKTDSNFSVFIPIGNGCNNFCSYCFVPFARGREVYRSAGEILKEAEEFLNKGYKEIVLIAQNVNSYFSIVTKNDLEYFTAKKIGDKITFPELLSAAAIIEKKSPLKRGVAGRIGLTGRVCGQPFFWLRFFTSHPKDLSDKLLAVIARHKNICRHIHLPAQAGDDKILSAMNRKYTRRHYLGLIKKIKAKIPEALISTDIIVGFPGETKKQFANTAALCRQAGFDMIYIGKFSPRPLTAAAKMKDNVSLEEKKRRERALMKILRESALKNSRKFLGKNILVLIEGKNKKGEWFGKNEQNKTVLASGAKNKDLRGQFVWVKITKARDFGLTGIIKN